MPKAVAVCDQVQLVREGVARVLDATRFQVRYSVRSLSEIVKDPIKKNDIDLIVLGIGDDFSLESIRQTLGELDETDPMTVVLATSPTRALIRTAMSSGIRAVLSKDISGEILSGALELVLLGQKFFPAYDDPAENEVERKAAIAATTPSTIPDHLQIRLPAASGHNDIQLSEREEQILCRLIAGAPNKTIARDLTITDATVKVHIKGLLRKLRVVNRTQAAIWGVSHGFGDARRAARRVNGLAATVNGVHASS